MVEVEVQETNSLLFQGWLGGWVGGVEEWRIKLASAKVEVEVEAEDELDNRRGEVHNPSEQLGAWGPLNQRPQKRTKEKRK